MKAQSFIELLNGPRAELALLATFNFEPLFFESCLLRTRALAEARRIVVFADAYELAAADMTGVRGLNCRYLVVPIRRSRGVFHPKLALLLSQESAVLFGGSANLSRAGCTHNLELLNSFPFSFADGESTPANSHLIAEGLSFYRDCARQASPELSQLIESWLDELPFSLPWLPNARQTAALAHDVRLCHTLDGDILSVIHAELGNKAPRAIRVLSPFYDDDLELASRFRAAWPKCPIEITAQQQKNTVPIQAFKKLGSKVTLHELRGAGARRLHGKLCAFEHAGGTLFVAGSANFTSAAFEGRNVETCFVWSERDRQFGDLFSGEITRRLIAPKEFDSGAEQRPEARQPHPGGWQASSAFLDEKNHLQIRFTALPQDPGPAVARLFLANETAPVVIVSLRTNGRDLGEHFLTPSQVELLSGPIRCEVTLGDRTSAPVWLVQKAFLTRETSESGGRSSDRESVIQETGDGLTERLDELGRSEGLMAVIEYLNRLTIRFIDEDRVSTRPFSVKPHNPFHLDELPSWLLARQELRQDCGAAVLEFVERHERRIFRAHARRPSLGGLKNFQDVLLAVTRLLYGAFASNDIHFSQVVGNLRRALEIFGLGFETENDESAGYTAGLLENLGGSRSDVMEAFRKHNTIAILQVLFMTAQRARSGLRYGDTGDVSHPLESVREIYARILSVLGVGKPNHADLETALQSLNMLTPEQVEWWLKSASA